MVEYYSDLYTQTNTNEFNFVQENYYENVIQYYFQETYAEKELLLPISLLRNEIGPFQTVVKYLKEEKKLNYAQIARITKRSIQTIWNTYSCIKSKKISFSDDFFIPVSIFDKKLSFLESVVIFLKEYYNIKKISNLLQLNVQTIYTLNRRARKKIGIIIK